MTSLFNTARRVLAVLSCIVIAVVTNACADGDGTAEAWDSGRGGFADAGGSPDADNSSVTDSPVVDGIIGRTVDPASGNDGSVFVVYDSEEAPEHEELQQALVDSGAFEQFAADLQSEFVSRPEIAGDLFT